MTSLGAAGSLAADVRSERTADPKTLTPIAGDFVPDLDLLPRVGRAVARSFGGDAARVARFFTDPDGQFALALARRSSGG
jgi:hypothetical protein